MGGDLVQEGVYDAGTWLKLYEDEQRELESWRSGDNLKTVLDRLIEESPEKKYRYSQDDKGAGRLFAKVFKNKHRWNATAKEWVYYDGNTVNPVVSMDDTEIRSQTALPLCTAFCTAKLAETASGTYALTYTLTAPEPEITSLYLACYDEKGVMLAIKDLPDAPQKGRDTITLSDFFETFSLTDMRRCKLFLIKNDTWSPVCKNWTGDLPA